MDITRMNDNELADMAANILTLLGGTELSAIDEHVRTELVTAIGTKPALLATQTAEAASIDGEKQAAFSVKDMTRFDVTEWTRQVRDLLKAGRATKDQFDLCGFDYPATRSKEYIAQDPSNLSGVGFSNGVNRLVFQGNNRGASIVYDIWRRQGDEGPWLQHALTRKQKFDDLGVTPGQYYEYRVRAVAAKTISNFSNSAVVYGVL